MTPQELGLLEFGRDGTIEYRAPLTDEEIAKVLNDIARLRREWELGGHKNFEAWLDAVEDLDRRDRLRRHYTGIRKDKDYAIVADPKTGDLIWWPKAQLTELGYGADASPTSFATTGDAIRAFADYMGWDEKKAFSETQRAYRDAHAADMIENGMDPKDAYKQTLSEYGTEYPTSDNVPVPLSWIMNAVIPRTTHNILDDEIRTKQGWTQPIAGDLLENAVTTGLGSILKAIAGTSAVASKIPSAATNFALRNPRLTRGVLEAGATALGRLGGHAYDDVFDVRNGLGPDAVNLATEAAIAGLVGGPIGGKLPTGKYNSKKSEVFAALHPESKVKLGYKGAADIPDNLLKAVERETPIREYLRSAYDDIPQDAVGRHEPLPSPVGGKNRTMKVQTSSDAPATDGDVIQAIRDPKTGRVTSTEVVRLSGKDQGGTIATTVDNFMDDLGADKLSEGQRKAHLELLKEYQDLNHPTHKLFWKQAPTTVKRHMDRLQEFDMYGPEHSEKVLKSNLLRKSFKLDDPALAESYKAAGKEYAKRATQTKGSTKHMPGSQNAVMNAFGEGRKYSDLSLAEKSGVDKLLSDRRRSNMIRQPAMAILGKLLPHGQDWRSHFGMLETDEPGQSPKNELTGSKSRLPSRSKYTGDLPERENASHLLNAKEKPNRKKD